MSDFICCGKIYYWEFSFLYVWLYSMNPSNFWVMIRFTFFEDTIQYCWVYRICNFFFFSNLETSKIKWKTGALLSIICHFIQMDEMPFCHSVDHSHLINRPHKAGKGEHPLINYFRVVSYTEDTVTFWILVFYCNIAY